MFCQSKRCYNERSTLSKLSDAALLTGGLMAAAYFGYKLYEKMRCKCKEKGTENYGCCCDPDEIEQHKFDHASENDCLSHAEKDYYGQCGCFDNSHGNPGTEGEEEAL